MVSDGRNQPGEPVFSGTGTVVGREYRGWMPVCWLSLGSMKKSSGAVPVLCTVTGIVTALPAGSVVRGCPAGRWRAYVDLVEADLAGERLGQFVTGDRAGEVHQQRPPARRGLLA